LVVTAFPFLGHLLVTGRPKKYFFISLVGLFAAVIASESSSALLGLVAGLAVWFFYDRHFRATAKVLTVTLPLAIIAMPVLVHPLATNPEPIARAIPNFPNSFIHRLLIWDFTLERIAERPLLGWGLDTSRAVPGGTDKRPIHYVVPWSEKPITHPDQNLPLHPHNAALQIWLELGFLGAIVAMLAVWTLLRTQLLSSRSGPMAGYIVCAMAIYCVAFGLMQSWWLALLILTWAAVKAAEPFKADRKSPVSESA
jgi:O-antigen ligase